jgi:Rrf2 family transcriptional regulator, iron-sulfur cluster assembly transcription factor
MRVTTKGRLAVAAVVDLALRQHRGPVTLAGISQRQRISLSYLEQLFAKLLRHQLVESTRGPGGGYRLAKPMESTSVADIILAVDESPAAAGGSGRENGENDQRCRTDELWANLNRQMIDFLDSVSLRDLVEQQRRPVAGAPSSLREATENSRVDVY